MGNVVWPANASAAGFSSNVLLQLPNNASTQVSALNLVTSLPTGTAGSEVSEFDIKTLDAGAQVTALAIKGHQLLTQDGTAALPTFAFASRANTGMYLDTTNNRIQFSVAGAASAYIDGNGTYVALGALGGLNISGDTAISRIAPNGDLRMFGPHDVVIGSSAALATNATSGFLQIPTCAGTPTGTVSIITGKACLVYDTTNFKLALSVGGGVWKQTAALT